jgi:purine-binding chemotaxis protein CheW
VIALSGYTRVPGAPVELLGVIHVRGEFLPLASLRRLLGLPEAEEHAGQALLCAGSRAPALAIDQVDGVLRVPEAELRAPEAAGSGCIAGLLADGTAVLRADLLLARISS